MIKSPLYQPVSVNIIKHKHIDHWNRTFHIQNIQSQGLIFFFNCLCVFFHVFSVYSALFMKANWIYFDSHILFDNLQCGFY